MLKVILKKYNAFGLPTKKNGYKNSNLLSKA